MTKFSLSAFQEACRAAGPLTLDVEAPPHGRQTIQLNQPFAILGAHTEAHIRWQDPLLNKRHAYLQVIGGSVFGVDLGSRTGLRWGDEPRPCGWVDGARPLVLGSTRVRIASTSAGSEAPLNPLTPESLAKGSPLLHLEIAAAAQQRPTFWTANRVLFLIGKSELCKVRLHGPEISRFHASVIHTSAGTWIVDLLSRSGVYVNGRRVQLARLDPGDQLRLGRFMIRVHATQPNSDNRPRGNEPLYPAVEVSAALQTVPGATGPLTRSAADVELAAPGLPTTLMEGVVLPLMREFSGMQQQMFDNFQQNLMMMFQMFQANQHEQMGLIREELAKIQEITLKVNMLQTELAQARGGAAQGALGTAPHERKAPTPPRAAQEAPAPPAPPSGQTRQDPFQKPPDRGQPRTHSPSASCPEILHASLCERLAGLQQERQTRFQKIMTFLVGK